MPLQNSVLDIIVQFGSGERELSAGIGAPLAIEYSGGGDLFTASVTISSVGYVLVYSTDDNLQSSNVGPSVLGLVLNDDELERLEVFGASGSPAQNISASLYFAH